MTDIFDLTKRPNEEVFFRSPFEDDPRLGGKVSPRPEDYEKSEIVIVGCPQDEGIVRAGWRKGASLAPDAIRKQFYKLTTFGIEKAIFDLGDVIIGPTLEYTHERLREVAVSVLQAGKRLLILGGGGDISYASGLAMAEAYGDENWIAVNIDGHLDVRKAAERTSETQIRMLLDEGRLSPEYLYEAGYQTHHTSPVHYEYIRNLGVNRISLEQLRSRAEADLELKEQIRRKLVHHSSSLNVFFSFDMDAVRSSDAPGVTTPSPLGLRAGEFIQLVKFAGSLANTRIVEFTDVSPEYDFDDRTTKLVAIAMHRICTAKA
jgi:formimidoylglutamase